MKERMTSKERVLRFLAREETDRVPRNFFANPDIDRRVREALGVSPDDHAGLKEALKLDFGGVNAHYAGPPLHDPVPGRIIDPWGSRTRWIEHGAGGYWDICDFPLKDATEEQVAEWPMPSPDDYDYRHIREACEGESHLAMHTGGQGVACVINRAGKLRGMEQALVDLVTDDPAGLLLMDRKQAIELEVMRRTLEAAHGGMDFLWIGEDLGTQGGPMISLDLYRKHIRPRHQPFVDLAKSFDIPVMIHTCGSSSFAYDDFIEMGISAVEALQPEAKDMSPGYLKARFGHALAFHGCVSTALAVSKGTPEDVEAECREALKTMMPGGGYCFAPAHMLQDNTPTDNALALYGAADRFGWYE